MTKLFSLICKFRCGIFIISSFLASFCCSADALAGSSLFDGASPYAAASSFADASAMALASPMTPSLAERDTLDWSTIQGWTDQGKYFEAGLAYDRFLFQLSNTPKEQDNAALMMELVRKRLEVFKKAGQFPQAINFINKWLSTDLPQDFLRYLLHQKVYCAYLAGQFETTIASVQQSNALYQSDRLPSWVAALEILSHNELNQFKEAAGLFETWIKNYGSATHQELLNSNDNPYAHIPKFKREEKAEALSTFIPGGGQFYAGKPLEGLLSIALQGAGIWFGVSSFLDKLYLSAWAGVGIFGSFHMGSARRSVYLVQQHNIKVKRSFNEQVRKILLDTPSQ